MSTLIPAVDGTSAPSTLVTSDLTKKKTIKKTLAIAIPLILVALAGVALVATTVVILATKTSIFKPSAKIIQRCSNNILGSAQNATASVKLQTLDGITQQMLDESLLKMWSKIKLQLPDIEGLPNTAEAVRAWLNDSSNKYLIESITDLRVHGLDLKILPPEIGNFTELKVLWVSDSNLTFLPSEIGLLKKLERLYLHGNKLASLPKEIGDCESLSRLYLRCNNLSSFPKEMEKLNLLSIDFAYNQFTSFPEVLKSLKPFNKDHMVMILFKENPFAPFNIKGGEVFQKLEKIANEMGYLIYRTSEFGDIIGFVKYGS